jgi:hypothetical protein
MTRTNHSYDEMAKTLRVLWCGGYFDGTRHGPLGVISNGIIHIDDRPPSLGATVMFLTLAARLIDPTLDEETVLWRRAHRLALAKRDLARKVHVRLPRSVFDFERAYVLAGVAGLTNEVPGRKRAYDWARR